MTTAALKRSVPEWQRALLHIHHALLTSRKGEEILWPLPQPLLHSLSKEQHLLMESMKLAFEGRNRTQLQHSLEEAARALNFEDMDAQLISRAWMLQSERLGGFDALSWPHFLPDFEQAWKHLSATSPDALDALDALDDLEALEPSPPSPALGLYVVVPDSLWVERMVQAQVPTVQLRFKSNDPKAIEDEINAAIKACAGSPTQLFINDHWEMAIQARAHGVHLGQEDLLALRAEQVQRIKSAGIRLGVSTHGYCEMLMAHQFKPSYMALGAVFATTLKQMKTLPQGLARLHQYAQLMQSYSLVAIGGMDQHSIPKALSLGVGSVAVVRAITGAPYPEAQAKELMKLFALRHGQ